MSARETPIEQYRRRHRETRTRAALAERALLALLAAPDDPIVRASAEKVAAEVLGRRMVDVMTAAELDLMEIACHLTNEPWPGGAPDPRHVVELAKRAGSALRSPAHARQDRMRDLGTAWRELVDGRVIQDAT